MDLSIIIVTWKSLSCLRSCISSIYRETDGITYEIIVVDNASADGSENVIRKEFPQVIFIQSHVNLGFARGNNLGYSRSTGEIVLFLNPDTELKEEVFAKMVAHLRLNASTGAVGVTLLNRDGSLQTSCVQTYPTIWNQMLNAELLQRVFPMWRTWGMRALFSNGGEPVEVDAISGACFMVKRNVFQEVGLFTEMYFMYVEDLDLSYKVTKSGYRIHYLPNCHVIHYGGQSSGKQGAFFSSLRQRESVLQFLQSTRGQFYCILYRATLGAAALVRMTLVVLSLPFGRFAFSGADRKVMLRKWFANFRWAVGLEPLAGTSDSSASTVSSSEITV